MIDIEWVVDKVEWDSQSGGVRSVRWRVVASEDGVSGAAPGTSMFTPDPSSETFVPLEGLTPETVIDWVKNSLLSVDAVENRALARLEKEKLPPTEQGLPWEAAQ